MVGGALPQLVHLLLGRLLHVVEEALDQRRISIGRSERRKHVNVAPGGAVGGALEDAVDVAYRGTATPGSSAGGQLNIDAALRRAAGIECIRFTQQVRVVLDELAQANIHALFVTLGNEDYVDRQLAVDGLVIHQGIQLRHFRSLGVRRSAADQHFGVLGKLVWLPGNNASFEWRRTQLVG